jgi:hypothetical protein
LVPNLLLSLEKENVFRSGPGLPLDVW